MAKRKNRETETAVHMAVIGAGSRRKAENLAVANPDFLSEWDYEANGDLVPGVFTEYAYKSVNWKCPQGHRYPARISEKREGRGKCPYCEGRMLWMGEDVTLDPEIKEKRKEEDRVKRAIYSKKRGNVEPTRKNREIRNLADANPAFLVEWDYEANGQKTPRDYTAMSAQKVHWICPNGHSYPARISHRQRGCGCPYCAGQKVWKGFNDIATVAPWAAAQWHPARNGELRPTAVTAHSNIKVWWQCSFGHEWKDSVAVVAGGRVCPYCSGWFDETGRHINKSEKHRSRLDTARVMRKAAAKAAAKRRTASAKPAAVSAMPEKIGCPRWTLDTVMF